ncbi:MAG: hemolysin family protein [Phycisphaerae bacterium]|jgi:putative hemolysin
MTWPEVLASHAWKLILLVPLLAGSAFFSGSETVLFNLSRLQLYRLGQGRRRGRMVASLMRRPRRVLNTLLLGNMCVTVSYTGIAAVTILALEEAGLSDWATVVASVASLLVLILFGDVLPKMVALAVGPRLAVPVAVTITIVERAAAPVLWVLEKVLIGPLTRLVAPLPTGAGDITAEELAVLLDLSAKRGVIDRDVNALLQEIVALTDIRVADIMVPRVDMLAYDVDGDSAKLIEMFTTTRLRKIPVYEKDVDHVLGVIHAKQLLLNSATPLRQLVAKVPFVPEAANVERLLLQFRVTRTQMAVVVDEYGGTAGLVTLEDVMEEIVGEIPDSRRAVGAAVQYLGEEEYLLDGDLAIHEWEQAFRIDLSSRRISTVGGFVLSLLGRIPREGEQVEYRNLRFTVVSMRRRRIDKLRLRLLGRRA